MTEVEIKFFKLNDRWRWHLSCGNWQQAGYGDSLKDAESHAFQYARGIPNHGTIHTVYDDGKPVDKPTMTFQEELVSSGFRKAFNETMSDPKTQEILNKLGSDYDENGVPYWEKI
jgi:hypothetical protein